MAEQNLSGTLIVSVLRGRDLINKDGIGQGVSDPFCKFTATAQPGNVALGKWSTKVIDNNLNPIWNEQFSVILEKDCQSVLLKFEVLDEDIGGATDSLGIFEVDIRPNFRFEIEQTYTLKGSTAKEKVKGDVIINVGYRKGEKVSVNPEAEERRKKKKGLKNLGSEAKNSLKEMRVNKGVLTECEEAKLGLLRKIYESNYEATCPIFDVVKEKLAMVYEYQKPAYQVDETSLTEARWHAAMKKSDGSFFVAAQRIIKELINFQVDKKNRGMREGYLTDPENLFCEEIKRWCAELLCTYDYSGTAQKHISIRVAYLEECLLVPDLFDKPSTLGHITIQQVIVSTRRTLKYQVLADIEKELATENASYAFQQLKNHCTKTIHNCNEFLIHVFRAEVDGVVTSADKLLRTLQEDANLKHVFADALTGEMDSIKGIKSLSEKYTFDMGAKGLKPVLSYLDIPTLNENDPTLSSIFVGPNSGVEEFFRGNSFIAYKFLKAHALLLELGRLFLVIEKAANCAKQGGTLLVYGVANAQLNALLDSTKDLITAIRDEFTSVCKIAECAFEKLVHENKATVERSKWMVHFKHVFPASNQINVAIKEVQADVSRIKQQANSMTLYERFQKAQNDTDDFLASANDFSSRTAAVLGQPYEKPKIKEEDLQKGSIDNTTQLFEKLNASVNK